MITGFYYSEHLLKVRTVVNKRKDNEVLVRKAKEALNNKTSVAGLLQICQYRFLADILQQMEGSDSTIMKAYTLLGDMQFESDPCVLSYIDQLSGFPILISKSL